jgi:hypothetical protein
VESANFSHLQRLVVWENPMTRAGLESLWERFGENVYPQRRQLDEEEGG